MDNIETYAVNHSEVDKDGERLMDAIYNDDTRKAKLAILAIKAEGREIPSIVYAGEEQDSNTGQWEEVYDRVINSKTSSKMVELLTKEGYKINLEDLLSLPVNKSTALISSNKDSISLSKDDFEKLQQVEKIYFSENGHFGGYKLGSTDKAPLPIKNIISSLIKNEVPLTDANYKDVYNDCMNKDSFIKNLVKSSSSLNTSKGDQRQ